MEPRQVERGSQEETLAGQRAGNAAAFHAAEGSSPGPDRARVEDTTGVCARGLLAAGSLGTVGERQGALGRCRIGAPGEQPSEPSGVAWSWALAGSAAEEPTQGSAHAGQPQDAERGSGGPRDPR
jgi:hypothetical protein